jgi:hypothetical protein
MEQQSEIKTLTIKVNGEEFTLTKNQRTNDPKIGKDFPTLARVLCKYEDGTEKAIWIGVNDLIDNIRMKGTKFSNADGEFTTL